MRRPTHFIIWLIAVVCVASSCSNSSGAGEIVAGVPDVAVGPDAELGFVDTTAGDTVADDGIPGFNGLVKNGCDSDVEMEGMEFELWGWLPISDVIGASNLTIEGTVTAISEPRISTVESNNPSLTQFYFRVVEVDVVRSDVHNDNFNAPPTVEIPLTGAGVGVDPGTLCYGGDGFQDDRERSLAVGSKIVVAGHYGSTPISGFDGKVLFLPRLLNSLWHVEDGIAVAVDDAHTIELEVLWGRLGDEVQAKRDGVRLDVQDSFSVLPEREIPEQAPTVMPEPPGIDAPNSATIPTAEGLDR